MYQYRTGIILLIILFLTACQPAAETPFPQKISPSSSPSTDVQETNQVSPVPTNTITTKPVSQQTKTPEIVKSEQPSDVLNFTFPTPVSEAVSLWRPPLLEAPWALSPFDHFYFSRPIAADEINWPLPNYRYGGIFFGTDIVHTGIDIPAPKGTPVLAAGKGKVIWVGYGLFYGTDNPDDPYGLAVSIEHDFGYKGKKLYSIYAHLDRIDVINGQHVETGTQLGIVGVTGKTTGPHLHFEVRIEENSFYTTRNPELWIAPPQGWGVLVGDFRNSNGSFLTEHVVRIKSISTGRKWQVITYGPTTVIGEAQG